MASVTREALHSSSWGENYVLHRLGLVQRHVQPPVMSSKYKPFILVRKSAVERWLVVNPEASAGKPCRLTNEMFTATSSSWSLNRQQAKSAASPDKFLTPDHWAFVTDVFTG